MCSYNFLSSKLRESIQTYTFRKPSTNKSKRCKSETNIASRDTRDTQSENPRLTLINSQ